MNTFYDIKTFDFNEINSVDEFHSKIAKLLNFPDFYGKNWNAFWDAITGLVEMPTNLIFYNFDKFVNISETNAHIFSNLFDEYNSLNLDHSILQFDYFEGLENNKIGTIFKNTPSQYGFRGDIHLWEDLEMKFKLVRTPQSEQELVAEIHKQMIVLTGKSTAGMKNYFVASYNTGGMSSGVISYKFWEKNAIPLLIARYRLIITD